MNAVWMVEWSGDYEDCNAAFSTREKAIAYIEREVKRMRLERFGFTFVTEDNYNDEIWWGVYTFQPLPNARVNVWYQRYPIDEGL